MSVPIVDLVHRGHVEAVGFWFGASQFDADDARGRVLDLYHPGASVLEFHGAHGGILLLLGSPTRLLASLCVGAPVIAVDRLLLTLPMTASQLRALGVNTDRAALVRCRGGE